ncbi:hypothetical protein FB566_3975 [Stackebrandtia endophytica]|uniref:Uncharacterized protein n=1 Tax=Stackebrandtia endophytica TaxID=1496996 RepID=A0A543B0P8_9ACTN|nr:hypothetical protein FB566_3975 [Stackebrandtia endophytica]
MGECGHPRVRGAYVQDITEMALTEGPSPRARGLQGLTCGAVVVVAESGA